MDQKEENKSNMDNANNSQLPVTSDNPQRRTSAALTIVPGPIGPNLTAGGLDSNGQIAPQQALNTLDAFRDQIPAMRDGTMTFSRDTAVSRIRAQSVQAQPRLLQPPTTNGTLTGQSTAAGANANLNRYPSLIVNNSNAPGFNHQTMTIPGGSIQVWHTPTSATTPQAHVTFGNTVFPNGFGQRSFDLLTPMPNEHNSNSTGASNGSPPTSSNIFHFTSRSSNLQRSSNGNAGINQSGACSTPNCPCPYCPLRGTALGCIGCMASSNARAQTGTGTSAPNGPANSLPSATDQNMNIDPEVVNRIATSFATILENAMPIASDIQQYIAESDIDFQKFFGDISKIILKKRDEDEDGTTEGQ